jgi:hypothetical protein
MQCLFSGEGRLFRDTPASLLKSKGPKGRGVRAQPPAQGVWELLGSSAEELTELGQKLQRSKKKPDRALASKAQPPCFAFFQPALLFDVYQPGFLLHVCQQPSVSTDSIFCRPLMQCKCIATQLMRST